MEYLSSAAVYTWFLVHVGVILVVTAYYALGASLAPRLTYRARCRFALRPWLPALIGLALSVPWVAGSLVLLNAPVGALKFAGALLGCAWLLCGLIGGAAMALHIGRSAATPDGSWLQSVRGGLFITLTWVLPIVGWLVMAPLTLATGVGCLILGLFPAPGERHSGAAVMQTVDPRMFSAGASMAPAHAGAPA